MNQSLSDHQDALRAYYFIMASRISLRAVFDQVFHAGVLFNTHEIGPMLDRIAAIGKDLQRMEDSYSMIAARTGEAVEEELK